MIIINHAKEYSSAYIILKSDELWISIFLNIFVYHISMLLKYHKPQFLPLILFKTKTQRVQ